MLPGNKFTSLYQIIDLKSHNLHNYTNGQFVLGNLHKCLWNNVFVFQMPLKINLTCRCAFSDPQQKFEQFVKMLCSTLLCSPHTEPRLCVGL